MIAQALRDVSVKPRIPVADIRRRLATLQRRAARQMRRCHPLLGQRFGSLGALGSGSAFRLAGARTKGAVRLPRPDRRAAAGGSQEEGQARSSSSPTAQFDKMVDLADQGPPTPALLADFAAVRREAMNEAPRRRSSATASSPPDDGTTLSAERPFPGLRPFGFADRAFFFGRERQTLRALSPRRRRGVSSR